MSVAAYMRHAGWEFALTALAAIALSYTVLDGFYIAPQMQYGPAPALVTAAVVVALYAANSAVLPRAVSCAVLGAVLVASLVVAAASSSVPVTQDAEGNLFLFLLPLYLVAVLSFALTRTRVGCAFFFVIGAGACAWVQFFYERYELVWALLFAAASLMLVIYKNYQTSALGATSVRKLSFGAGAAVAAAAVGASMLVGCVAWFAIIAPLDPSAAQIKLVTEYRALEPKPVQGTSSEYMVPNMDLTSDKTGNDERTTDDLKQSDDGRPMPAKPKDDAQGQQQQESSGSFLGVDIESVTRAFDFQTNTQQAWRNLVFVLLAALAIVAYFVLRRRLRRRRLEKIRKLPADQQVSELYLFLLDRLAKVGFAVPAGSTPLEFARNNEQAMARFDAQSKTSFLALTEEYARVAYGGHASSPAAARRFADYYEGFWKAAREQLGNVRYFLRSFRL